MAQVDFRDLANELADRQGLSGVTILVTIALLMVTFFVWAANTELDGVVRGEGKIISSAQNQIVQATESGVILTRHVSENSEVRAGDILFELDPVEASSELNRINQRMLSLRIKELRLRAEISSDELVIPSSLSASAPVVASAELSLFIARRNDLDGNLRILNEQLNQRRQGLAAAEREEQTARRTATLIREEILVVEPLVSENLAPATRLLTLRRELESAEGQIAASQITQRQVTSSIEEIQMQLSNTTEAFRLRAMSELNTLVSEQAELSEAIPRLEERLSRTIIRAPMDGIVNRLNYRTPGGYVAAGNAVLEIVPTGEDLVVQARIPAKDISRINLDDAVKIRLAAYDAQRYGFIDGIVIRISPDAVQGDDPTAGSHYMIEVAMTNAIVQEGQDEPVMLIPGMTASVEVLHGKRSVLEYLWRPLARIQDTALRD